jgi:hypothetical protein
VEKHLCSSALGAGKYGFYLAVKEDFSWAEVGVGIST